MKNTQDKITAGFTLVEVIITLLVAVILGAVMVQYLGAVTRSSRPIKRLAADTALQSAADRIIGDFRQKAPFDAGSWADFQSGIGAAGTNQNNAYGQYRVRFNDFIQFDTTGTEITDIQGTAPEDMLKVVISGTSDDPLTLLLIR